MKRADEKKALEAELLANPVKANASEALFILQMKDRWDDADRSEALRLKEIIAAA